MKYVTLETLKRFELGNTTLREILATKMDVSFSEVEDVINSTGGWNWLKTIARDNFPPKSASHVKRFLLSNLENNVQFKIMEQWNKTIDSFLIFNFEGISIQLIWYIE